jgi:hypothetical protein
MVRRFQLKIFNFHNFSIFINRSFNLILTKFLKETNLLPDYIALM